MLLSVVIPVLNEAQTILFLARLQDTPTDNGPQPHRSLSGMGHR
jgi:hypothetical protein